MKLGLQCNEGVDLTPRLIEGGLKDYQLVVGNHYWLTLSDIEVGTPYKVQTAKGKKIQGRTQADPHRVGWTCRTAENGMLTVEAMDDTTTLMYNTVASTVDSDPEPTA